MDQRGCATCDRTFPSATARARHELRCRARPRTRKKACEQCSRSKVKCDNQTPACARCAVMQLACAYPQGGAAAPRDVPQAQGLAPEPTALPPPPTALPDEWLQSCGHGSAGWGWGDGMQGWEVQASCLELGAPYFMDSSGESSSGTYADTATATAAATATAGSSTGTADGAAPTPFASLSSYLADQWTTAERGLDYVDAQCKRWADGLLGDSPPPFVHARDWEPTRRHRYLLPTTSTAQLYAMGTPDSKDVLVSVITSQLHQMQVAKHERADDIAALQMVLLCTAMKQYRGSEIAEPIDRLSTRSCQHILSKHAGKMEAHTQVDQGDWDDWIFNESLCRSFFALHSLDYVVNARQGNPTALCALFPECPLPSPDHVWHAPDAAEWAARRRRWAERCGGEALRGRHILSWLRGVETGREIALEEWLREAGAFGEMLFVCGRAQGGTFGAGEVL